MMYRSTIMQKNLLILLRAVNHTFSQGSLHSCFGWSAWIIIHTSQNKSICSQMIERSFKFHAMLPRDPKSQSGLTCLKIMNFWILLFRPKSKYSENLHKFLHTTNPALYNHSLSAEKLASRKFLRGKSIVSTKILTAPHPHTLASIKGA